MLWASLEIIGTIAFAASGALVGIKKRLDIFGITLLAIVTAVGGGILRDTILGNTPPLSLTHPAFILLSIAVAGIVSFSVKKVIRRQKLLNLFDAIGLGAFTATGASLGINYDNILLVLTLGVLTGIGGGVIRDLLVLEIPFVLQREVYATASLIGALTFYALQLYLPVDIAIYPAFIMTTGVRLYALHYKIDLPRIRSER